jgi:hypothetical protein
VSVSSKMVEVGDHQWGECRYTIVDAGAIQRDPVAEARSCGGATLTCVVSACSTFFVLASTHRRNL